MVFVINVVYWWDVQFLDYAGVAGVGQVIFGDFVLIGFVLVVVGS